MGDIDRRVIGLYLAHSRDSSGSIDATRQCPQRSRVSSALHHTEKGVYYSNSKCDTATP
jgi:hypothetical protein